MRSLRLPDSKAFGMLVMANQHLPKYYYKDTEISTKETPTTVIHCSFRIVAC